YENSGGSHSSYGHYLLRKGFRCHAVMPTNAIIDGQFANLKNKLRNHNGLTRKRKMKFIDEFLRHKGF
ncbi:MAG TPA: hypothetical protein PLI65_07070, partial [Bacteroidales bacterium]|nr:hypothetical protein [Bacteroidales bacterium]